MFPLNKLLFLNFMMLGTFIAISSYSWLGMWMGLEINLLCIIPLMNNKYIPISSESSLKYFITQSLASTILLYSLILMSKNLNFYYFVDFNYLMLLNLSLFIKMGAAPFHFWFPEIIDGLDWFSSFLILTWQKIAPMMILLSNISSLKFIIFVIISSMLIGGIQGLNQTSMRKILAYSSINHIGWMISSLLLTFFVWFVYFMIYSLISLVIILILSYYQIYHLNQFISQFSFNSLLKLNLSLNFLSLGGLPPFLGFFPKWLVINSLSSAGFVYLPVFMVILTLITLYYYVRLILSSLMLDFYKFNFVKISNFKLSIHFFVFNMVNLMGLLLIIFFYTNS
uniref:NADH-ubiquinone oxidoreductase chain 2 n=1 Tax=Lasioderma redtenbacheri TaxID=1587376 RepID=A0A343C323_9COLE|nr:NADH dehydrogenase subunit 2 [Lasioderma redtenbacheri]